MKKALILFCLAAVCASPVWAANLTPLQIGFWGPQVQLFPEPTRVTGLRLNVLKSDNQDVTGFDLGIVSQADQMKAIQVNLVNLVDQEFSGVSMGLFSQYGSLAGIQVSLFNNVGFNASGFQIGLFNAADDMNGLQVGLFNQAKSMQGLQVGVINIITEGPITFFPLINGAF